MYESYWQVDSKPFDNTSDARRYYPGEAHQGALLKLRYAIENRRGAALLTGAAGLGKTLLVHALARQLPEAFSPLVHLVFPEMPPEQLLAYLADELAATCTPTTPTVSDSVRRIQQALAENRQAGRHAVVAIDEAHLLRNSGTLETIRLLMNFECQGQSALTLLLIGQPALLPTLERAVELDERLAVKCLLRPFTCEETHGYVQHRLSAAGARRPIFRDDAVEALHYLSGGVPRRINRLGDLALLIGYAEEQPSLGAAQIEAVADELVTVSPE